MVTPGPIAVSDLRIDAPAAGASARLPIVDAARGAALLAMVVYHAAWDLSFYDLIETDIGGSLAWQVFARCIAGSFLALVGVSLVLAQRGGMRPRAFLRRLALVGSAAAAVTLVTWALFPEDFIYFGILHCIAVSSVLGLPFLRLPVWLVLAAAVACLAAPWLFSAPVFDAPAWRWLGLMTYFPRTNDYVPLLPWFGMVLAGIAAARLALASAPDAAWARWQPRGWAFRMLVRGGRHSLAVYLLHQPVLLGALYLVALTVGPNAAAESEQFQQGCQASCIQAGTEAATCTASCVCVADGLKSAGLWRKATAGHLDPEEESQLFAISRQCRSGREAPAGLSSQP